MGHILEINYLTITTTKTKDDQATNHPQLTQKVSIVSIKQEVVQLVNQHQVVLKKVGFLVEVKAVAPLQNQVDLLEGRDETQKNKTSYK